MSITRTLTVLHDGGDIVVGDLYGAANPVVALNDHAMSELLLALRDAQSRALALKSTVDVTAIIKLCEALGRIIETYSASRNKYFGGVSEPVERANLIREIEQLAKELERFH
ncbi:MAG TPA: hypothetical protein VFV17_11185 [Usitatibacteraceae bacterium]|nr:hypothetical protein [Usitatibacteraceae bacterium]